VLSRSYNLPANFATRVAQVYFFVGLHCFQFVAYSSHKRYRLSPLAMAFTELVAKPSSGCRCVNANAVFLFRIAPIHLFLVLALSQQQQQALQQQQTKELHADAASEVRFRAGKDTNPKFDVLS
jgi:hypothetical protein